MYCTLRQGSQLVWTFHESLDITWNICSVYELLNNYHRWDKTSSMMKIQDAISSRLKSLMSESCVLRYKPASVHVKTEQLYQLINMSQLNLMLIMRRTVWMIITCITARWSMTRCRTTFSLYISCRSSCDCWVRCQNTFSVIAAFLWFMLIQLASDVNLRMLLLQVFSCSRWETKNEAKHCRCASQQNLEKKGCSGFRRGGRKQRVKKQIIPQPQL